MTWLKGLMTSLYGDVGGFPFNVLSVLLTATVFALLATVIHVLADRMLNPYTFQEIEVCIRKTAVKTECHKEFRRVQSSPDD